MIPPAVVVEVAVVVVVVLAIVLVVEEEEEWEEEEEEEEEEVLSCNLQTPGVGVAGRRCRTGNSLGLNNWQYFSFELLALVKS